MVAAAKSQRSAKQGHDHRVTTDTRAADSDEEIESEEDDVSEGTGEQSSEEGSDEGAEHNGDDSASGNEEEEDEIDDDGDDVDEQEQSNARIESQLAVSGEQCTFDLRNLVAVNSHQLNASSLHSSKRLAGESDITIPLEDSRIQVDEEQLLEKARDGCAQLISAIWKLPTEKSDAGPLVTLPSYFEIKIPRALVSYGWSLLGNTWWAEIY